MRLLTPLLSLGIVLAGAYSASAQQPRAPAGGAWYGGHFYKGGQFMPQGSGFMGYGPGVTLGLGSFAADTSEPQPRYRSKARSAGRLRYRTESKVGTSATTTDEVARAKSRLAMARNLINLGKFEQARQWLVEVIKMNASDETIQDAHDLLSKLGKELPGAEAPPRNPANLGAR